MSGIRELRADLLEKAKKELNEDPSRRAADIAHIREWLKKQPHIRANPDDQTLITFLRGCKHSLERAKEKIDMYYTMRTALPEFYKNRNLRDNNFRALVEAQTYFPLPGLDREGRRVILIRPGAPDSSTFTMVDFIRMTFMVTDVLMREDDDLMVSGVVNLIDVKGVSLNLAAQFTPSVGKKTLVASQEGLPMRPKSVNYINTPSYVTPFIALVKSLTKEKVRKRFYVHGDDMEALYRQIPKEILPTEYGGNAGTMKEINDAWLAKLDTYNDWFLADSASGVDESKRPGKPKTQQDLFGLEGSFRQLSVD